VSTRTNRPRPYVEFSDDTAAKKRQTSQASRDWAARTTQPRRLVDPCLFSGLLHAPMIILPAGGQARNLTSPHLWTVAIKCAFQPRTNSH